MPESIGKIKSKKSGPNYTYAVLSVALVLFLLGFFGLVALHTEQLIRLMKEQVNILVEIKPATEQAQIKELIAQIDSSDYTKAATVQYISKEEALKELKNDLGEDFLQFNFQNPLYNMIRFNTKAAYVSGEQLEKIKNGLQINESVNAVYYQEGLVEKVGKNMEKLAWFAIISGCLLLLVALTLIHNTIKLALYANRMIIKNMELVGASWRFISWPYLKKGIMNGFWSAAIAILMLSALLFGIQGELEEIKQLSDWQTLGLLFGLLILIGMFISGSSTYYVVNKYLKMRLDDLY